MLFIAERNRKEVVLERGGKIQRRSTFLFQREKIYIDIQSAERVSSIAFSEPFETGRLVSQPCAPDDEIEWSCVRSLLGRGDCAIAVAHATESHNRVAWFSFVCWANDSFAGVDRLKIFLRFPLSAKERIKDIRIVESISRKRGKSLEKYIFFFTRAHNCHHLCEFLQEFLHVSFHGLHCKFVSEKLFRPDTFGPMQKLFPLIKLPRQLSPGSGAFVSFSSLQRDRSMHNYNVKKK